MKHFWMLVAVALLLAQAWAEVRIEDVRATPVAPWGRIVVDYTVAGTLPANAADYMATVTASNRLTGRVYEYWTPSGETTLTLGKHRIWWDSRAVGLREASEAVDVRVLYFFPTYCVIDLSDGPNAVVYPVSYLSDFPSKGWIYEYKTTKLVLRRIPAGSFVMGSDQTNESRRVALTRPFYMGVFEVTQKQWELVMGSWPGSSPSSSRGRGDAYPAYYVSYDDIRGSSSGARWPASSAADASSFLGRLRAKTGLDFDLPTEAQWEYACRAGTATTYYWGDAMDGAYAWYSDNSATVGNLGRTTTHPVGTRKPNAWGLYDMSGNVREWCRDWYGTPAYGTDPVGSASGSYRVLRGGSWYYDSGYCTSSHRINNDPSNRYDNNGFRLVRVLSD